MLVNFVKRHKGDIMIILYSDIIVDFLRQYPPAVNWLRSLGDEEIALPGFVVMELIQGCTNKVELHRLEKFIADFEVICPSTETCDKALEVYFLYYLSHNLGLLDALIGQAVVALGLPLYTFNRKHYAVIPGLVTIQPYQK